MRVIVLGANGQLGGEVVRHVAARSHKVTAFVRQPPNGLLDQTAEIRLGDARKREDLIAALLRNRVETLRSVCQEKC